MSHKIADLAEEMIPLSKNNLLIKIRRGQPVEDLTLSTVVEAPIWLCYNMLSMTFKDVSRYFASMVSQPGELAMDSMADDTHHVSQVSNFDVTPPSSYVREEIEMNIFKDMDGPRKRTKAKVSSRKGRSRSPIDIKRSLAHRATIQNRLTLGLRDKTLLGIKRRYIHASEEDFSQGPRIVCPDLSNFDRPPKHVVMVDRLCGIYSILRMQLNRVYDRKTRVFNTCLNEGKPFEEIATLQVPTKVALQQGFNSILRTKATLNAEEAQNFDFYLLDCNPLVRFKVKTVIFLARFKRIDAADSAMSSLYTEIDRAFRVD